MELLPPKLNSPIIIVGGPTASGKSDEAVAIAEAIGGEVVNTDAVHLYKDFNLASAKPDKYLLERVPHHLIDVWSPSQPLTVADFLNLAWPVLLDLDKRKKPAVVVAPGGMYLTALIQGLAGLPGENTELREKYAVMDLRELYDQLRARDAEVARTVNPNDRVRITRLLESLEGSASTVTELRAEFRQRSKPLSAMFVLLNWERGALHARIKMRASAMISQGLMEEVLSLKEKYGRDVWPMQSIGYAEGLAVLEGQLNEADLEQSIVESTRQLAKRQLTYWKNEPQKRGWNLPREIVQDKKAKEIVGKAASTAEVVALVREGLKSDNPRGFVWQRA